MCQYDKTLVNDMRLDSLRIRKSRVGMFRQLAIGDRRLQGKSFPLYICSRVLFLNLTHNTIVRGSNYKAVCGCSYERQISRKMLPCICLSLLIFRFRCICGKEMWMLDQKKHLKLSFCSVSCKFFVFFMETKSRQIKNEITISISHFLEITFYGALKCSISMLSFPF